MDRVCSRGAGFTSEMVCASRNGTAFPHNCAVDTAVLANGAAPGQVAGPRLHAADRIKFWTRFSGMGVSSKLFWVITA